MHRNKNKIMKLIIFFVATIPIVCSNPINSDIKKLDCIVTYLRDRNLLDKKFKYHVESEDLECDSIIAEFRHEELNKVFSKLTESSNENVTPTKMGNYVLQSRGCIQEKLNLLNFTELMMKMFVYKKSNQTLKGVKKNLRIAEKDVIKKFIIAASMCQQASFYGDIFDGLMTASNEYKTLSEQQFDHCIRKYAVDRNLIDTTVYRINMNPYNIGLNFKCENMIKNFIEAISQKTRSVFETIFNDPKEIKCLERPIESIDYIVKTIVLSKINLTFEEKNKLRDEYIEKARTNQIEMVTCLSVS